MTAPSPDDEFRAQLQRRIAGYCALRNQLEQRVEEIQDELASLERRLTAAQQLYEAEFGDFVAPSGDGGPTHIPDLVGDLRDLSWADALARVLLAAGRPMHVSELWQSLQAGGFKTQARDPVRSIVAIAIRSPRFAKVAPNVYSTNGSGGH